MWLFNCAKEYRESVYGLDWIIPSKCDWVMLEKQTLIEQIWGSYEAFENIVYMSSSSDIIYANTTQTKIMVFGEHWYK